MNYSIIADLFITPNNLFQDLNRFWLGETFLGGYEFAQISAVAKLGDDVCIIFGGQDVENFDNIGSFLKRFEHIYFGIK